MFEAGEWGSYFHPFVCPCDLRYNVLWCKWEVWVWGLLWICSHPHLPFLLSIPADQRCAHRACGLAFTATISEAWQGSGDLRTDRQGGQCWDRLARAHLVAVITLRVAGQPSWPMHMHGPALGNWGVGRSPGRAPYGKCVGFLFFFFWDYQNKRSKKGKRRKEKKTLEIGSYKVND